MRREGTAVLPGLLEGIWGVGVFSLSVNCQRESAVAADCNVSRMPISIQRTTDVARSVRAADDMRVRQPDAIS